jgi:predicted ABC-class ATPase
VANEATALAELMTAMANAAREGGVRAMVRHIATFMDGQQAREHLDALRERLQREKSLESLEQKHPVTIIAAESGMPVAEIADALIALDETRRRRRTEQTTAHSH